MISHTELSDKDLRSRIKNQEIGFAGNQKLKIYGILGCKSGKKMKRENRVFFNTEKEALAKKYRPCGHCMSANYKKWKDGFI
ncbi:Ada metal-binding domain-containing protein [Pedobacter aquatilis]|uniref:Ada metal-binding domain-containing protein n=1 Tax=Pedobacter aquatilis TaxID=351343 RepID=UPI0025B55B63|nr:Ada metal-binding domain-containing protein [Pedobacter aquatilis]MDN3585100.1 Ada metal-binding domain-containing protein [Pedobacter aquatilis]